MSDQLTRAPSPRFAALLLLRPSDKLSQEQQPFVDRLTAADPMAAKIRELGGEFVRLVPERQRSKLDDWIGQAGQSAAAELRRFAAGQRDYEAVCAALEELWSNGPDEG